MRSTGEPFGGLHKASLKRLQIAARPNQYSKEGRGNRICHHHCKAECRDDVLRVYRAVISRVLEAKGSIQYSGRSLLWASGVFIGGRVICTIGMVGKPEGF